MLSKIPSLSESLSEVYGGMSGQPSSSSKSLYLSGSDGQESSVSITPSSSESFKITELGGMESGHPS